MAIGTGLNEYLEWHRSGYWWQQPSLGRAVAHSAEWLAFGAMWGWLTWDEKKHMESLR
jgi:hypothetical protein